MTFGQSIKICFSNYAVFKGRATRSEFWWFALFLVGVGFIGDLLIPEEVAYLIGLFWLATVIPWLAVTWRRLHDVGLAGPWFFISFIPFGIVVLIIMLAWKSQPKENKYGKGQGRHQ